MNERFCHVTMGTSTRNSSYKRDFSCAASQGGSGSVTICIYQSVESGLRGGSPVSALTRATLEDIAIRNEQLARLMTIIAKMDERSRDLIGPLLEDEAAKVHAGFWK